MIKKNYKKKKKGKKKRGDRVKEKTDSTLK